MNNWECLEPGAKCKYRSRKSYPGAKLASYREVILIKHGLRGEDGDQSPCLIASEKEQVNVYCLIQKVDELIEANLKIQKNLRDLFDRKWESSAEFRFAIVDELTENYGQCIDDLGGLVNLCERILNASKNLR